MALTHKRTNFESGPLRHVEIHRELMSAAARWTMALKLASVLSVRRAMRLNSMSLPKKFSIRRRHLYLGALFVEIGDTKTERIRDGLKVVARLLVFHC